MCWSSHLRPPMLCGRSYRSRPVPYGQVMESYQFRMKNTLVSRKVAIIADEFHLFGGQRGLGWRKLDKAGSASQGSVDLAQCDTSVQRCRALLLRAACARTTIAVVPR